MLSLLSRFRPHICDRNFPLTARFAAHRVRSFRLSFMGADTRKAFRLVRNGNSWDESPDAEAQPGLPEIVLTTPATLVFDVRDSSVLGSQVTEESVCRALMSNPKQLMRDAHEPDRRYHPVLLGGKHVGVFSIRESEVRPIEVQLERQHSKLVRVACGIAIATKVALQDIAQQHHDADVAVVHDQAFFLVVPLSNGRIRSRDGKDIHFMEVKAGDQSAMADLCDTIFHASEASDKERKVIAYYRTPASSHEAGSFALPDFEVKTFTTPLSALCFA